MPKNKKSTSSSSSSSSSSNSNNNKRSYDEALSALTGALSEREKDLDEREKQLEQDRQTLDRDRNSTYGDKAPTDVLHLNIGGVKATVLRRTLTSVPNSMLASKFSGRWDDSIEKDENGHFFIGQDYPLFRHIIQYLQNKANGDEKYIVQSPKLVGSDELENYTLHDLYRMIDYYGLTNGMYPVALRVHDGASVKGMDTKCINAQELTTCIIAPKGHARRVKTFEVTLGNVQRIQIGWAINGSFMRRSVNLDNGGIGHKIGTFALDLTQSSYLFEGQRTPVDGLLEHSEGTVVRSENYGKVWYVNGNIVEPCIFIKNMWDEVCLSTGRDGRRNLKRTVEPHPIISLKGEIEISLVELED